MSYVDGEKHVVALAEGMMALWRTFWIIPSRGLNIYFPAVRIIETNSITILAAFVRNE